MQINGDFFENSPLIQINEKENRCSKLFSLNHEQRILATKIGFVFSGVLILGIEGFLLYDSINVLQTKTPESGASIRAYIQLGIAAGLGVAACSISALFGVRLGQFQNAVSHHPSVKYFQGDFSSKINRNFLLSEIKNVELWKPYIKSFLFKMEQLGILKLKLEDQEEVTLDFAEHLNVGLCYGTSITLLTKMQSYAGLSSRELLDKLVPENVIYYQCLEKIINNYFIGYLGQQGLDDLNTLARSANPNMYEKCKKNLDQLNVLHSELMKENIGRYDRMHLKDEERHCLLAYISNVRHFKDFLFFKFAGMNTQELFVFRNEQNLSCYDWDKEKLKKYLISGKDSIMAQAQNNLSHITLAGLISFYIDEKEKPGHSYFFQMSDDHFRFCDPGYSNDFFEFPSEELMIENLFYHTEYMKQGWEKLNFTLLGIPKASFRKVIN